MVFPIAGGTQSTDYEISNSLRLHDGDSPYLSKTPGSAGNRRTFTISVWAKRSDKNTSAVLYGAGSAATDMFQIIMQNDGGNNSIIVQNRVSGTNNLNLVTSAKFGDVSAWYHIVLAVDTTQGTDSNRAKLYVNGTQITAFSTETYPSQNYDCHVNNTVAHHIGAQSRGSANDHFDGYITELHSIDGTAQAQTAFGKFNDNAVWIPIKYTGGSYGTNGFFMEFKETGTGTNSSGIGADTSGQDNHFAVNNLAAIDITEDTCTNNFCTMNPLTQSEPGNVPAFKEGNLQIQIADFDTESIMSTIGVTRGKWYWEVKNGWKTSNWGLGIAPASLSNTGFSVGYTATSYSFSQNGYKNNNSNATQIDSGLSDGDIIGYALDLDNGYFNFSQNGTWYNGSASESTTFDTSNHDFTGLSFGTEIVMITMSGFANQSITTDINFGNPTFSISSGNSDANGYGTFEYEPPSGYYSICTKNLAEFG